ncbi:MAG: sugar-transfer associated ATP-grasp domain-containing protein [Opitutales bacterium]
MTEDSPEAPDSPAKPTPSKSPLPTVKLLHTTVICLAIAVISLVAYRIYEEPALLVDIIPETVYELEYTLVLDGQGGDIQVKTFLPENADNQRIDHLDIITGAMAYSQEDTSQGLQGTWEAINPTGLRKIGYSARFSTSALRYEIDPALTLTSGPNPAINPADIGSTPFIRVEDPTVSEWLAKEPFSQSQSIYDFLRATFDTLRAELEYNALAATTDSATALALSGGNAADHAYAMAALVRAKGLPCRVANGYLLNTAELREHYWNEVLIQDHWVPFCLRFNHFAEIPDTFLRKRDASISGSSTESIAGVIVIESRIGSRFLTPRHENENPEVTATDSFNLVSFLHGLGLDRQTSGLFLMFPLAALITAFFRNILGFQTFGVFMPMLIAGACRYTGLASGMVIFAVVIFLATVFHLLLERLRMHNISKMAAVITLITIIMLGLLSWKELSLYADINVLAVFPVVILSFTANRMSSLIDDRDWTTLIRNSIWSLVLILLCYIVYDSSLLRGLFGTFPELIALVFVLQVWVGCWVALRLSEYFRFRNLIRARKDEPDFNAESSILGINMRNREIVQELNTRSAIQMANDKIASKKAFEEHKVPCPATLFTVTDFRQIDEVEELTKGIQSMVIKPAKGSQGNGITLLVRREGDTFFQSSGQPWSLKDIAHNMREITLGTYSKSGENDAVLVEALMTPTTIFNSLVPKGVPDVRVIILNQKPVAAMLRLPTAQSGGKSNLHQGAIGVDVDLETGVCGRAQHNGKPTDTHPDSGAKVTGFRIPGWSRVLAVAGQAQRAVPLAYAGVDICIDEEYGPVVIEINARPGIEIQNIRKEGLQGVLAKELSPDIS